MTSAYSSEKVWEVMARQIPWKVEKQMQKGKRDIQGTQLLIVTIIFTTQMVGQGLEDVQDGGSRANFKMKIKLRSVCSKFERKRRRG